MHLPRLSTILECWDIIDLIWVRMVVAYINLMSKLIYTDTLCFSSTSERIQSGIVPAVVHHHNSHHSSLHPTLTCPLPLHPCNSTYCLN